MVSFRKTAVEVLVLGFLGFALAVGVNAVRGSSSVQWTKDYFDKGLAPVAVPTTEVAAQQPVEVVSEPSPRPAKTLAHPYQSITFGELAQVYDKQACEPGLFVFVDARSEKAYADGHIEGAVRCDPYHAIDCIDHVLDYANGAEKVVLYCHGGNCEDSIFMCRELINAGIPYEAIYLYPGGYEEWQKNKMPISQGCE
jgi:rhodanese-related sulfurtransferase